MSGNVYEYLTFNGKNMLDFKCKISGGGTFGSSEWDTDTIQIPGRDGDVLVSNKRTNNQDVPYDAYIVEDFRTNFESMRDFLMQDDQYHRLEDTYHPDYYMIGKYKGGLDPKVGARNHGATFTLEFSCIPHRYLKSGEHRISITASTVLMNPTYNVAKPMIYVTGTGSFTIGNVGMAVTKNNGALVIDCETQECYEGQENRNGDVTISSTDTEYDFPVLKSGRNTITVSGVTLEIEPRWFVR
jgi:phage-related protein